MQFFCKLNVWWGCLFASNGKNAWKTFFTRKELNWALSPLVEFKSFKMGQVKSSPLRKPPPQPQPHGEEATNTSPTFLSVASSPTIIQVHNVLTPDQCKSIITYAQSRFRPSKVAGQVGLSKDRTSSSVFLTSMNSAFIDHKTFIYKLAHPLRYALTTHFMIYMQESR